MTHLAKSCAFSRSTFKGRSNPPFLASPSWHSRQYFSKNPDEADGNGAATTASAIRNQDPKRRWSFHFIKKALFLTWRTADKFSNRAAGRVVPLPGSCKNLRGERP